MASINQIQLERVLLDAARYFYSTGIVPSDTQIRQVVSDFFSRHDIGRPLELPDNLAQTGTQSDVDVFNTAMSQVLVNLQVLYDASNSQVDDLLSVISTLRTSLDKLQSRRRQIETLIDDYLLSQSNTDGYFFAASDNFATTSLTDLNMTTAYVDTAAREVVLPSISGLTQILGSEWVSSASFTATVGGNAYSNIKTITDFSAAVDPRQNRAWEIQIALDAPAEVVLTVTVSLNSNNVYPTLSQIRFDPYGMQPLQVSVNTTAPNATDQLPFGNIVTSDTLMTFNAVTQQVGSVQFLLRKTQYDFVDTSTGSSKYVYMFGAKSIQFISQVYDTDATWVSQTISFPNELQNEMVMDAVSLETVQSTPPGTSLTFYVAEDTGGKTEADFIWKPITPISGTGSTSNQIVSFNGAQGITQNIVAQPTQNDLQLIPLNNSIDPNLQNPSLNLVPGADIYRIANLPTDLAYKSIILEEGVNRSRIFSMPFSNAVLAAADSWTGVQVAASNVMTLADWANVVNAPAATPIAYGDITSGFFYGGDVGASGQNVYVETYLYIDGTPPPPILATCRKTNSNSSTWNVQIYVNGNPVASMPAGVDSLTVPYVFRSGVNHIALTVQIPTPTANVPNPYIGSFSLMDQYQLSEFGTVKLGNWNEVSFFDLAYNQANATQPYFALNQGQIVSRKQPGTNLRVTYYVKNPSGPTGIRVRADLTKDQAQSGVTPALQQYRVRFAYAQQVN